MTPVTNDLRVRFLTAAAGVVLGALATLAPGATLPAAADLDGLGVSATLDGRRADQIDANAPLDLDPDRELRVAVDIVNRTSVPVTVRSVRLDGRALNLTFFNYTTRIDRVVPPGETADAEFTVDVSDLGSQAVGLLPGRLVLLDQDRDELSALEFPVDVHGPLTSAYGVFGVMVAVVTLLLLATALFRLARRTLPPHRWDRAMRFAIPGMGLGLTLTFTLSALRVLVPDGDLWLALVVVGGLVGLVAGFFTPAPDVPAWYRVPDEAPPGADEAPEEQPAAEERPASVAVTSPDPSSGPTQN